MTHCYYLEINSVMEHSSFVLPSLLHLLESISNIKFYFKENFKICNKISSFSVTLLNMNNYTECFEKIC